MRIGLSAQLGLQTLSYSEHTCREWVAAAPTFEDDGMEEGVLWLLSAIQQPERQGGVSCADDCMAVVSQLLLCSAPSVHAPLMQLGLDSISAVVR